MSNNSILITKSGEDLFTLKDSAPNINVDKSFEAHKITLRSKEVACLPGQVQFFFQQV